MPEQTVAPEPQPGNGNLQRRVDRLEQSEVQVKERLIRLETRTEAFIGQMATKADLAQLAEKIEQMASQMATKADLAVLEARMLKWFIGTSITLTALVFAVTRSGG